MDFIKIATWNIGSLYDGKGNHHAALRQIVNDYSPDVLAVQELPNQQTLITELASLLGAEGYHFVNCSPSHVAKDMEMGICIFSKFPIKTCGELKMDPLLVTSYVRNGKEEHLHQKYFTCCEISVGEESLRVITGHGYPVHRYQIPVEIFSPSFIQLDRWVADLLKDFPAENVIVACDFNIPDPLSYMENLQKTHVDPFRYMCTRPAGRKTDSLLTHKERKIHEAVNIRTGFDHNFVMLTL